MLVLIKISLTSLLIILIANFQLLYSEEQKQTTPLTFFNLKDAANLDGQLITIRGFLYESSESQMILAAEPNLKTCCVGSTSQQQRQLLVTGDINLVNSAITLKGNLVVSLGDDFPFRLENAVIMPQNDQSYWILGGIVVGLILLSGGALLKVQKRFQ